MIIENCNVNKLHTEFVKAGAIPSLVLDLDNGKGDFVFPESVDITVVQAIIDVHNPEPVPQPPTPDERISALETLILQLGGVI